MPRLGARMDNSDEDVAQAISTLLDEEEVCIKSLFDSLLHERRAQLEHRLASTLLELEYPKEQGVKADRRSSPSEVTLADIQFQEDDILGLQRDTWSSSTGVPSTDLSSMAACGAEQNSDSVRSSALSAPDFKKSVRRHLGSGGSSTQAIKNIACLLRQNPHHVTQWMGRRRLPLSLSTRCSQIASSRWFEILITVAILLSAVFTAVAASESLSRAVNSWQQLPQGVRPASVAFQQPFWIKGVEIAFALVFFFELIINLLSKELLFFFGDGVKWNLLDTILVACAWLDILMQIWASNVQTVSSIRVIRVLRVLRSLRVVRVLHVFRELRVVLLSLLGCVVPLFWALFCVFIILFVFIVFFMQGIGEFIALEPGASTSADTVLLHFGGFGDTLLTLVKVITGGKEWGGLYDSLRPVSSMHAICFVMYVILMTVGALNVITGIFVENATTKARQDFEVAKTESVNKGQRTTRRLVKLFKKLDKNMTGFVSLSQWREFTCLDEVQACFGILDIDVTKTEDVFQLLDLDGSGEIELHEFISGCLQIQGIATSLDVEMLTRVIKALVGRTQAQMDTVKKDILQEVGHQRKVLTQILTRVEDVEHL